MGIRCGLHERRLCAESVLCKARQTALSTKLAFGHKFTFVEIADVSVPLFQNGRRSKLLHVLDVVGRSAASRAVQGALLAFDLVQPRYVVHALVGLCQTQDMHFGGG